MKQYAIHTLPSKYKCNLRKNYFNKIYYQTVNNNSSNYVFKIPILKHFLSHSNVLNLKHHMTEIKSNIEINILKIKNLKHSLSEWNSYILWDLMIDNVTQIPWLVIQNIIFSTHFVKIDLWDTEHFIISMQATFHNIPMFDGILPYGTINDDKSHLFYDKNITIISDYLMSVNRVYNMSQIAHNTFHQIFGCYCNRGYQIGLSKDVCDHVLSYCDMKTVRKGKHGGFGCEQCQQMRAVCKQFCAHR